MRRRLSAITNLVSLVRLLWAASPGWNLLCALLSVLSAGLNVAMLPVIGQLVQAASHPSPAVWRWFAALAGVQLACQVLGALAGLAYQVAKRANVAHVVQWIAQAGQEPGGLEWIEGEPGSQLRLTNSQLGQWETTASLGWVWDVLSARLSLLGVLAVVFAWNWWASLLALGSVALLSLAYDRWVAGLIPAPDDPPNRVDEQHNEYLRELLIGVQPAKEVRLFGWLGWLHEGYVRTWKALELVRWSRTRQSQGPMMGALLVVLVTQGGAMLLVASDAFAGALSVAAAVTVIQAIIGLNEYGILGDPQIYVTRFAARVAPVARLRVTVDCRPTESATR